MARLRPTHWPWMVEQSAIAGHRVDTQIQPPPVFFDKPYRDYQGLVCPAYSAWTPRTLTDLADDYDLEEATVRHVELERAGNRLNGFLILGLVRSYDPDEGTLGSSPTLDVHLNGVTDVDVDTSTALGVRLDFTAHGVSLGLGPQGVLRARTASLRLDDPCWHLSGAGRRADTQIPPRQVRSRVEHPPQQGKLEGSTQGAATFLLWAMRRIRSVRHPREVARVPVQAYCRALRGAGQDIVEAGALPSRRREATFRSLMVTWLRRGGSALAPDWKLLLHHVPDAEELLQETRDDLVEGGTVPPLPDSSEEVTDFPEKAELRMVSYTAEPTDTHSHRDVSAMVHLAVPVGEEGAPWRLRVLTVTDSARLRARTEAFGGTRSVRIAKGRNGPEAFVVEDDALAIGAHTWGRAPSSP